MLIFWVSQNSSLVRLLIIEEKMKGSFEDFWKALKVVSKAPVRLFWVWWWGWMLSRRLGCLKVHLIGSFPLAYQSSAPGRFSHGMISKEH